MSASGADNVGAEKEKEKDKEANESLIQEKLSSSENEICVKCQKKFDPGVKYSTIDDKPYHRECLVCSRCQQPIMDKMRQMRQDQLEEGILKTVRKEVDENGDLIGYECYDCFYNNTAQTCAICDKKIIDTSSIYKEDNGVKVSYHKSCLVCSNPSCKKQIFGEGSDMDKTKAFFEESSVLCENCYVDNLEACFICKEKCRGKFMRSGDKAYHDECVTCAGGEDCLSGVKSTWASCAIIRDPKSPDNLLFFCDYCWMKRKKTCAGCQQKIMDKTLAFGEGKEKKYYHEQCVRCSECNEKQLCADKPVLFMEGKMICEDCRDKMCPSCRHCGKIIQESHRSVRTRDKKLDDAEVTWSFHKACLNCYNCGRSLADSSIEFSLTPDVSQNVGCKDCILQNFYSKCTKCSNYLVGKYSVVADKKYCHNCLICAKCKNELGSKLKTNDEGDFICAFDCTPSPAVEP